MAFWVECCTINPPVVDPVTLEDGPAVVPDSDLILTWCVPMLGDDEMIPPFDVPAAKTCALAVAFIVVRS